MLVLESSLAIAAACGVVAAGSAAGADASASHLYLYPASASAASSVRISPADANRILSYHLDVPGERLGVVSRDAQDKDAWAFAEHRSTADSVFDAAKNRLVIYVDGVQDPSSILPAGEYIPQTHVVESSPPSHSWLALISTYGDRLASSGANLFGGRLVESIADAAQNVKDWFSSSKSGAKKVLDIFDLSPSEAMAHLYSELEHFTAHFEGLSEKQGQQFQALRFQSLPAIEAAYGKDSEQYRTATSAISAAIKSAIAQFKKHAGNTARFALILSNHGAQQDDDKVAKRGIDSQHLLTPFSTGARRQYESQSFYDEMDYYSMRPSLASDSFHPYASGGAPKESDYLGKCFTSKDALFKATKECNSHGDAVERDFAGRKCYRCVCKPSHSGNGVTYWAGEACEKQDISRPFILLGATSIVLVILVAGLISFVVKEGSLDLPGTLGSVSIPNIRT